MAEQDALYFGKRQNTLDPPAGFGVEELRAMSESALDDGLPPGTMEESGFGAAGYEFIPTREIGRLQLLYAHRLRRRRPHADARRTSDWRGVHQWPGPRDRCKSSAACMRLRHQTRARALEPFAEDCHDTLRRPAIRSEERRVGKEWRSRR